jgi:hypothetical protein
MASKNGHVEIVNLLLADSRVSKCDLAKDLLSKSRMRLLQLTHQSGSHSVLPSSLIHLIIEFAGEPYVTPDKLQKLEDYFTKIKDRRKTAATTTLGLYCSRCHLAT